MKTFHLSSKRLLQFWLLGNSTRISYFVQFVPGRLRTYTDRVSWSFSAHFPEFSWKSTDYHQGFLFCRSHAEITFSFNLFLSPTGLCSCASCCGNMNVILCSSSFFFFATIYLLPSANIFSCLTAVVFCEQKCKNWSISADKGVLHRETLSPLKCTDRLCRTETHRRPLEWPVSCRLMSLPLENQQRRLERKHCSQSSPLLNQLFSSREELGDDTNTYAFRVYSTVSWGNLRRTTSDLQRHWRRKVDETLLTG